MPTAKYLSNVMKRIDIGRWIILGLIIGLAISCDTEKNIKPRDESHFLKVYGGEGDQQGVDMVLLDSGNFILFGTTRLPGKTSQLYLVKADPKGNVIWERTYGGSQDEEARDIELTRNSNIVIVGNTKTVDGDRDIMIMTVSQDGLKIDSTGYSLNSATVKLDEVANSVTETSDGFIVAGYTNNVKPKPEPPGGSGVPDLKDALYVRFLNNPLRVYPDTWASVGGAKSSDETTKIVEVGSNFYMFGFTNNTVSRDYNYWYFGIGTGGVSVGDVKIPYLGNEICTKAILNPPDIGGGVMIGSSINASGDSSIYMVKLRSPLTFTSLGGDIESIQVISSTLNLAGASICYSKFSGGYFILSDQRSGGGNSDIALTRVGNGLLPEWTQPTSLIFGGACEDTAGAVAELPDGHVMIIGTIRTGDECESKMALIKVNKDGKFEE